MIQEPQDPKFLNASSVGTLHSLRIGVNRNDAVVFAAKGTIAGRRASILSVKEQSLDRSCPI
ncbi:hypothetical protein [Egbenema bharatensis]|uniref:hypothetical protein n=1 Tax=Egbenema bharatensis TaxID=3463334 RepID=UPI003A8A6F5E